MSQPNDNRSNIPAMDATIGVEAQIISNTIDVPPTSKKRPSVVNNSTGAARMSSNKKMIVADKT
jgi:hypothetical protein